MFVGEDAGGGGGGVVGEGRVSAAEIDALEARLAATAGLVHAATATLVRITGEALASGAWAQAGIRSPAHWLAWQSGLGLARCARLVRMAERAAELPVTTAAFRAGSLSEDQVHEIVANVPAAHDGEVAGFARTATVTQLHKVAREHSFTPAPADDDEPVPPAKPSDRDDANQVSFTIDENGRLRLQADLEAGPGALVRKALEACRDAEFHARHPDAEADARPAGVTWADALTRMADAAVAGLSGDRPAGERHQVIIHLRQGDPERSWAHLGAGLSPAAQRYLSCDATWRTLVEDDHGVALFLGRKQRSVTPHQRLVVEDRDKGCRRPGCAQTRWLHIHHLDHWEHGGLTDIDRMCALCPRDHDLHHRGLLGIEGDPTRSDGLTFTDHRGRVLRPCGTPTPVDPDHGLDETAGHLGIPPPDWTHPSGERLDPWSVSFRDPPVPNASGSAA